MMNSHFAEINSIISICDNMIEEIKSKGALPAGNPSFRMYKQRIKGFLKYNNLMQRDYGPYYALDALYFTDSHKVNLSAAKTIRRIVTDMKHDLFPDSFDKIFVSHREKNREQVNEFIDLLHAIGIPRPTVHDNSKMIFCTSHPATYIDNGERNLEIIKKQFNDSDHIYYILWYTDEYFESQACLNEMGAIWATSGRYQEILMPNFDSSKIGGLLDKQPVWFRADDKFRLNSFRKQIETMFDLNPLEENAWEAARDSYITRITATSKS